MVASKVGRIAAAAGSSCRKCLRGIVFDMDGTLTVPAIDFQGMYRAVLGQDHPRIRSGITKNIDILQEIQAWSSDKQQEALSIIAQFENQGKERLQIMPGAMELCKFLDAKRLRRGLITRNTKESVDFFHKRFGMPEFFPAVSREFGPFKPNPAPLLHVCDCWAIPPPEVLMIGDSIHDDVVCGNRAGALTCLVNDDDDGDDDDPSSQHKPTFRVKSLLDIQALLLSSFELTSV